MKQSIANGVAEKLHRLATDADNPITRALGGCVARVMLEETHARVEWDDC